MLRPGEVGIDGAEVAGNHYVAHSRDTRSASESLVIRAESNIVEEFRTYLDDAPDFGWVGNLQLFRLSNH